MDTIPRISNALPQHMNIKNQIRMKRQNTDVTLFAFHMSEAHPIYCENNLQKKVSTLFSRKGGLYDNFFSMVNPKKTDRRKNVCYQIPCLNCSFCYIGETSQWWDQQESQHKRSIKNKDSNNSFFMHLREYPDHVIGWEQVTFLACDSRYSQRRMKESILIDIFSHKGVMNIEDGMKKYACWNVLLPSLRKNFSDSRIT